jgi:HK97 family phage portal protein
MNIFQRIFLKEKKDATILLTNEDWKIISSMLLKYVNRDQNINTIVNKTDYITKAYLYNATIFAIISLRANAAKGVPWLVYKVKNSQKLREYRNITRKDMDLHKTLVLKEQSLEEVEKGPINDLLKHPNPYMKFADLMEGMFIYRDVTGDAYMFHVDNDSTKEILQLHLLPADKTKIVGGVFLDPIAGYRVDSVFDSPLLPEKVLHWKYFNPLWDADGRQLYGISPLVSATRMINADNEGINNEASSFANEGVKGILTGTESTEIEWTKEQADLLIKKLKKATDRAKAGEGNIAFNRAPMNYLKIGETPVNLGVLDSRKYNKEIFCNVFRIHPALLSSDASTLNNLKEARKSLMTLSVMPDLDSFREGFNDMIQKSFGEEWFVDYDIMAISELQDDIEKIAKTYQSMDWVTINEKRAATNYDAYKDVNADILMTDMGKVPLGYGMDSGFERIDEEIQKRR